MTSYVSVTLDASQISYIVTSWDPSLRSVTEVTEHRTEVSFYWIPHPYNIYKQ